MGPPSSIPSFPRGSTGAPGTSRDLAGVQKTPIPHIVCFVPTFRARSGFSSKMWTNSVSSHLSPPPDVSGWDVSSFSAGVAWPGQEPE